MYYDENMQKVLQLIQEMLQAPKIDAAIRQLLAHLQQILGLQDIAWVQDQHVQIYLHAQQNNTDDSVYLELEHHIQSMQAVWRTAKHPVFLATAQQVGSQPKINAQPHLFFWTLRAQGETVALVFGTRNPQQAPWSPEEIEHFMLYQSVGVLLARLYHEDQLYQQREAALRLIGETLEARDGENYGHTERVTQLALRLGEYFELSAARLQALRWGAFLHDIGKSNIPDDILGKLGKLELHEWQIMRLHVEEGRRLADRLGFLPEESLAVIEQHHECWDGTGYPRGLRGEHIALEARIFSVCEVYDTLSHARPYKKAYTPQAALDELQRHAGTFYDPKVVQALLKVHPILWPSEQV